MLNHFLTWLQALPVPTAIREGTWEFPLIETVHVLALALVVGSISMLDLRLLQVSSRNRSVTGLSTEVLPWTWISFLVAVIAGALMFSAKATQYWADWPFRLKMVCIVLAGLNMTYFHFVTWKTVHDWDTAPRTPPAVKLAGGLSLFFWLMVVAFGRWIGFTV